MPRLKIWEGSSWRYVDNPTNITASLTSSYAITASYALNGGGGPVVSASYASTSSWSQSSITSSYFNEASASLITGSFYLRSNSGSLWKITVYEDGDHVGSLQLEGPF